MSSVDNTLHEYGADNPVPLSRIHSIIEDGEAAFWSVVADRFPEVKSGCFSWDAQDELSRALELAVRRWLNANTDTCEVCGNREGFNGVELSGFDIRLWNNPDADIRDPADIPVCSVECGAKLASGLYLMERDVDGDTGA